MAANWEPEPCSAYIIIFEEELFYGKEKLITLTVLRVDTFADDFFQVAN